MDNFLNRLYRNPYAPLDAASITRVDDAGNGYDDWNNMIAPATAPHKQTWGEIGQNALMSPVRIGASLLDSINPYQANEHPITEPDASNWRVPPLATETWNAISAPGRAYYEGMSPEEMQHTAATAAGLMMGGGGITSGLESAAARGGVSLGDRVMAKYLDWKHPNTWQTPTPDVSSSKLAWRYGADLNTNDILQRYSPMEVRAGNMFGEPDLSKLNRYQTELLNKLTSDDARYADLNRRPIRPDLSVIDGGLAANADTKASLDAIAKRQAGAEQRITPMLANALSDEGKGIIAYHGSPHDFDRFDMSKIGTGEGAQAYGSGLYFAENEGVAKAYRDTLAPDHAKYAAGNYKAVYGDGALDAAMRDGDTVAAEYLKAEKEGTAKAPGHMYQVRINANPEDFLDWDKPLSQQNPNVIGLAKKMGIPLDKPSRDWAQDGTTWNLGTVDDYPLPFGSIKHRPTYNDYDTSYYSRGVGGGSYFKNLEDAKKWVETQIASIPDNRKGSDLYNSLSDDSVEASRLLKEAGVPGISYYDQLSRASPELDQLINGTRNHVLLDDSLIDILKKYGLAGMSLYGANNALSDKTTY